MIRLKTLCSKMIDTGGKALRNVYEAGFSGNNSKITDQTMLVLKKFIMWPLHIEIMEI